MSMNPVTVAWVAAVPIVGTIAYVTDKCRETYENVKEYEIDSIVEVEKMRCKVVEDWGVRTGPTPQFIDNGSRGAGGQGRILDA